MPRSGASTASCSRRSELAARVRGRCRDDLEGARELLAEGEDDRSCARSSRRRRRGSRQLEEEIRLAMVERDPNDAKNVLVEIRAGTGGDEAALFAGDLYKMLTRYAEERGFSTEVLSQSASEVGRLQGGHLRGQGRGRLLGLQVRGRHPPRAAGAGDRVAGPDPHLDRDRRGAARGRGGRGRDRPERPADRRLPLLRARRPVGQHDRLGGADHPQTDRDRRLDAGREVPAAEQGAGDAGAAGAAATSASWPSSRRRSPPSARPRSAAASARRRSAPTTSPRAGSPTTGSSTPRTTSTGVLGGELAEFTDALAAEEKRQRLEAAAAAAMSRWRRCRRERRAKRWARPSTRCGGRGRGARASTPNCCWREATGLGPGGAGRPSRRPRCRRRRRAAFGEMVRRRLRREPVAYILGRKGFRADRARGRPAGADPAARRPSCWSSWRSSASRRRCSTSAPARARSRWRSPTSCPAARSPRPTPRPAALEVARANAERLGLAERVELRRGHRCREGESFDLVLANLPYVAERDWPSLAARGHAMGAARGAARRPRRPRRDPRLRPGCGRASARMRRKARQRSRSRWGRGRRRRSRR